MSTKIYLIIVILSNLGLAQATEQEYLGGNYELIEYFFKSVPGNNDSIHCTEEEIYDGLVGSIFGDSDDLGRSLDPSYQPTHRDGSWLISQDSCASQKPYYNGLGFESIDKKTGEAVIYVAGFNRKPAKNKPGISGFASDVYRGYNVTNIAKFKASCTLEDSTFLIFGAQTLVCTLEENQGFIKFRKQY